MTIAEFRETYQVPAYVGHRVVINGKPGKIVGTQGGHLKVRFDGMPYWLFCHPQCRVTYIEAPGGAFGYGDDGRDKA
jgi:hypothetical protein